MEARGVELKRYGLNTAEVIRRLVVATICLFFAATVEPIVEPPDIFIILLWSAGLFAGFWFFVSVLYTLYKGTRLTLYENGISKTSRRQEQFWQWADLSPKIRSFPGLPLSYSLYDMVTLFNIGAYHVRTRAGEKAFSISGMYVDMVELANIIFDQTKSSVTREYITSFRHGETLEFGTFRLNQQSWGDDKLQIQWRDLKRYTFDTEHKTLSVKSQGKPRKKWTIGDTMPDIWIMFFMMHYAVQFISKRSLD